MPEQMQDNPIYKFMKANDLTKLDEKAFLDKYSAPDKAKEIHSFMVSNNLTDLDDSKFYDKYLKKKDQGVSLSVSSPTQSLSPDFKKGKAFAEKGFLMQPEGTKAPKKQKISIEPSLSLLGVPKVEVLEEGEDPSILADFTSSALKGQIQGKVANILSAGKRPTPEELGEIAQLQTDLQAFPQSKAEKVYQEKGLKGIFKDSPALGVQFVAETITSSLSSLFEASKRTVPTGVAMGAAAGAPFAGIGALPGAATGFLASQSAAGYNISTSQDILNSLSENGVDISNKESLINAFSDEKKMAKIRSTAAKYGVPILVFDALTAGFAGKFAAGAVGKSLSKKLLAGLGETGLQITGGSGGELAAQVVSGKKVNWDDIIIEGIAEVPGGVTEVATGVTMERSKTSSNNKTLATQIATQGVQNGVEDSFINLNRDLANNVITPEQYQEGVSFVEKAAQVVDKIPQKVTGENKVKSIELLVERNDINQANQDLLQQKQNTDVAYHAGIDQEIKSNEERIKKLDAEVYNIAKKPSKELAKQVSSEVKITEEEPPIIEEYDLKNGDIITANIGGVEEKGKVIGVGKNKGEIVIDFIDENNNERFVYANQVKNIEKGQAEIDNRSVAQKNRLKELLNKEELSKEELSELDQLNKAKSEVKQIEQAKEVKPTEVKVTEEVKPIAEVMEFGGNKYNVVERKNINIEEIDKELPSFVKGGLPIKQFAQYLNKPEILTEKQLAIYNKLKNNESIGDTAILVSESNDLIDGFNRVKANLALGKTNFDIIKVKPIAQETLKAEVKPTEVKQPTKKPEAQKVSQPELAPVKEKRESFTTKSGRQKVQYEKGQLIVRDAKTGKEVSYATRKKAIDEYVENFDFNKGERFSEVVSEIPSGLSDEEGKRFIIENSKNPLEVLETYAAEPKESKLTTEEQLIADYGLGKLTQKGFKRFGDENLITGGMALTYFNKEGTPIDVRAKEMSDYYGKEITPQDIVNFMIAYPSGASQAVRMGESRVAREAAEKFKELTGIDLNSKVAERIIDAEIAKAESFEQELIKQEYETREQLEAEYYKASAEADRLAEEGNRSATKESEKTKETELAKEYKEAVGKASKKAKENAKKDFVDRNFDNIVQKLKIQIKCPT